MNLLIIKLNATGDVVRTTSLLRQLRGDVTWVTAPLNTPLLENLPQVTKCFSWGPESLSTIRSETYDLIINLEDDLNIAREVTSLSAKQRFGAYLTPSGSVAYTDDSRPWFDLSIISRFGRDSADRLKLQNRSSYQELIFKGLGLRFNSDPYVLPQPTTTTLCGDIAIAPVAGPVWPMKGWAYYERLKEHFTRQGCVVNVLPRRNSLLEHLGDIKNHRCVVSGDSLPMHLALGLRVPCVTIFNCTSPWEIFDYGCQTKHISPLLSEHFYKRSFDLRATTAVSLEDVVASVERTLAAAV